MDTMQNLHLLILRLRLRNAITFNLHTYIAIKNYPNNLHHHLTFSIAQWAVWVVRKALQQPCSLLASISSKT